MEGRESKSAVDRVGKAVAIRAGRRRLLGWAGAATIAIGACAALLPLTGSHGRLIGWLLLGAGLIELVAARARQKDEARATMGVAGSVTALAALAFLLNPLVGLYSLVSVIMSWLFARGAILLAAAAKALGPGRSWALFGGIGDLALALVLLIGLPVTALVAEVFGQTPEVVSQLALVLAASFLISGFALIAVAGRAFGEEDEGSPGR